MSAKEKRGKRLSGRFAVFITVLLFVCTVIFLNNKFSSGSLRRISYWIFNGIRGDATEASISFDANEYNRFAVLNGNLCIISPEELSAYKLSGSAILSKPVLLRSPAVSSSNSRFIAYDLGGVNFYVANSKKLLYSGTTEDKILNVNMNKSGFFSIVTDAPDSKSLVTIYNPDFKSIYKFHSSEKYVFDAAVSPDGKSAAIITYGTTEGSFESTLALAKTNADGFYSTVSLGNSMPLKVSYHSDSKISVICNDRTLLYSTNGNLVAEISHNELPVKAFSQSGGKLTSVLLDNYQNGGNTRLILIKNNGESLSVDLPEDVYSLSSAGNYTAVQFSDKCIVYKNDLSVHCEFKIPATVTRCIANSDGSVLAVGDNFAMLYVK